MPIRLITGLPGHGKTLLMMEGLAAQAAKADRPIFISGVDGLKPGFGEVLDNARDWNAIDATKEGTCTCRGRAPHAHRVPNGSIIFVDEAWKAFGHLHDARGQSTPEAVLDLAEHRHRGIDFVWTTQSPIQIYPFARALIGEHTHVVRRFGTRFAHLYTWSELNEDVKSKAKRDASVDRIWRYDGRVFDMYQSATQHTIKRKLPWKLVLLPICGVAAVVLGVLFYEHVKPSAFAAEQAKRLEAIAPQGARTQATSQEHDKKPKFAGLADYLVQHTPRVAGRPWSAPIYDEREPTTDPRIFCVIRGMTTDPKSLCTCFTEQATPYSEKITDHECRYYAIRGVYDPYIQPSPAEVRASVVQQNGRADRPDQGAGGGGQLGYGQAHYGQMRGTDAADDKPYQGTLTFGSHN